MGSSRTARPSGLEIAILATAWIVGIAILGLIAFKVTFDGATWSGGTSLLLDDSMQYLWWVRDASEHLVTGSKFTLYAETRTFLHPGAAAAGLLHLLGLPVPIAYAIWIPVAAALLCGAVFAFVSSNIRPGAARSVALALALLYSFPPLLVSWALSGTSKWSLALISLETSTLSSLWGYPFSALAVGLTCVAMLLYVAARESGSSFSPLLTATVLLAAWLQPWQGATIVLATAACEVTVRTRRLRLHGKARSGSLPLLAIVAAAAATPIAYYWLLGRFDSAWKASEGNADFASAGQKWWMFIIVILPLALPAMLTLREPVDGIRPVILRTWPAAAVFQAILLSVTGAASAPSHAMRGVAIPLAILAVQGATSLFRDRRKALATLALGSALAIGAIGAVQQGSKAVKSVVGHGVEAAAASDFMQPDDVRALEWLDRSPVAGGVIATPSLAPMVPWRTGRGVWFGHGVWTDNAVGRKAAVSDLFSGRPCCQRRLLFMPPDKFAAATGARFALIGCEAGSERATAQLLPSARSFRRFGCATVIQLPPGNADRARDIATLYGRR